MSDINWAGLVQRRNPFSDFAEGMERGSDMRLQRQEADQEAARREAYNLFTTDPAGAEKALLAAGDVRGAEAMRQRRESDGQRFNRGMLGMMAQKDPQAAQERAFQVGEYDFADKIGKLDEQQRKAAAERAGVMVAYIDSFAGKSPEEIRAQIMQDAPALMELGYSQEQLANFQPTPGVIAKMRAEALGLKGVLEQRDREADNKRADDQAAETKRYHGVLENQGNARIGIARGQLGIAQGRLGLSREAHAARLRGVGGYGTPGVGGIVADDDVEIDP